MTPDHSVETRYLASIFRLHQFNYSNEHICQIDAKYRVSTFFLGKGKPVPYY
jgi:hypothetical protein